MTDDELTHLITGSLRSKARNVQGLNAILAACFLGLAVAMPFLPYKEGERGLTIGGATAVALIGAYLVFTAIKVGKDAAAAAPRILALIFECPQELSSSKIIDYRRGDIPQGLEVELKTVDGKEYSITMPSVAASNAVMARIRAPRA